VTTEAPGPPVLAGPRVLQVGRLLGVPVQLSPTWFLLAALVVVTYGPTLAPADERLRGYLAAACCAVLLLLSVLLHELGHCVAARLLGLRVGRVTVSFLAGVTEVLDPPQTPARAYAVSAAGPMVSLLLTGLFLVPAQALAPGSTTRDVLTVLALSNAGLTLFNLLPGLPLDGGAVLRAAVWQLTGDQARGTVAAAQAGRALGAVVVPLAVLGLPLLLGSRLSLVGVATGALIAGFVYAGASASLRAARTEQRARGLSAASLARPALSVPADVPLAEALRRAHDARLHAMVVVDESGRPRAVVSEAAVQAVPEHRRPWVAVGAFARALEPGLVLAPDLAGEALLDAVRRVPASEYVVTDEASTPHVLAASDLVARLSG